MHPDMTYLTVDEVADLFKMSTDWVRRGVQAGRFPHLRLGGKRGAVRFTVEHVREIARLHEQRPTAQPTTEPVSVIDTSVFGTSQRSRKMKRLAPAG
jgi:excisionase family DNA binding protein